MVGKLGFVWVLAFFFVLFENYRIGPWKGEPKESFWERHSGYESRFKVELPDRPADFVVDMADYSGRWPKPPKPKTAHWLAARGPNRVDFYLAGFLYYGGEFSFDRSVTVSQDAMRGGFEMALGDFERRLGGKINVVAESDSELGGRPAKEYILDIPGPGLIYPRRRRGVCRVSPGGLFLFFALAVTPTNKNYNKPVDHFFENFSY